MKKALLFGAGYCCEEFLKNTYNPPYQIVAVADSAPQKWGEDICGYTIVSPDRIKEFIFDIICIMVMNSQSFVEIRKQLVEDYSIDPNVIVNEYEFVTGTRESVINPRLWDCFPFFNELDLLDLRLRVLDDVVDRFVIVEMSRTQRGRKKDFVFQDNRHRFERYLDKIVYIRVEDDEIPSLGSIIRTRNNGEKVDWTIENFQRESIIKGLRGCGQDDIVCISDVDEIPNPIVLQTIKENCVFPHRSVISSLVEHGPVALELKMYMGYLNCRTHNNWLGCAIGKRRFVHSPQDFRINMELYPKVPDSGWHLTWMGGEQKIRAKIAALCEGVEQTEEYNEKVVKDIIDGKGMPTNGCGCFVENLSELDFPLAAELAKTNREWFFDAEKDTVICG